MNSTVRSIKKLQIPKDSAEGENMDVQPSTSSAKEIITYKLDPATGSLTLEDTLTDEDFDKGMKDAGELLDTFFPMDVDVEKLLKLSLGDIEKHLTNQMPEVALDEAEDNIIATYDST